MLNFLMFFMLAISPANQSDQLFIASDSLFNKDGIIQLGSREGWRFHPGDNQNWARPDFDDSQGTGLGLSLAYDIVKAHGGELKVETKEGEGSVITMILKF